MHIVSPIFESGKVWYPSGEKFADEVIEEVASFLMATMMTFVIV